MSRNGFNTVSQHKNALAAFAWALPITGRRSTAMKSAFTENARSKAGDIRRLCRRFRLYRKVFFVKSMLFLY